MCLHVGRFRGAVTLPVAVSGQGSSKVQRSRSRAGGPTVIRNLEDVENLRNRPQQLLSSRRISLELESLDTSQTRYFEARLNQLATACGCESGAMAGMIALAGYIGYLLVTTGWHLRWIVSYFVWGAALFLAAAVIGKLVGLVRARARLVRELEHLAGRLQHPSSIVDPS